MPTDAHPPYADAGYDPQPGGQLVLSRLSSLRDQLDNLCTQLGQSAEVQPTDQCLYVTCFGHFVVYRRGKLLNGGLAGHAGQLFRFLVANAGHLMSHDILVDLLWPDDDVHAALHRLHTLVSGLRSALDGDGQRGSCIARVDQHYVVDSTCVATDCRRFDNHYAAGRRAARADDHEIACLEFGRALELACSDFLCEYPYEEWTIPYRAQYSQQRFRALAYLCDRHLSRGRLMSAHELAAEMLRIEPLSELAHRQIMRANYMLGQRACAIRQFHQCQTTLDRELGVPPSRETAALYEAIAADVPLPPEAPPEF